MKHLLSLLAVAILLLILILLVVWPFDQNTTVQLRQAENSLGSQVLRFGYNIPERSALHLAAMRFKEEIERQTEGRIEIQLFPNQALGNDHQMLEMARRGELDLLLIPSAKLSVALPEMQYADMPFLLPAREDMYAMLDGEPGRLLLEKMNKINMVGVTFWGNGFKHFTANRPLKKPSDFAGLKIRIMKSRLLRDQFNLMGAEAVPIDFHETRQALLDGVVDGQENPLVAIHSMGIHEAQTDLTLSEHAYLAYIFAISGKRFNQLPGRLQTLLIETARAITPWQRAETERQESEFLAEIAATGINIHRLSRSERIQFQRSVQPLADRYETTIGADILAYTHEYATLQHPQENRWLIGVDTDLSTVSPKLGLEIKRGAELAVERFRRADPTLIPDIRVITRDNRNLIGRSNRTLDDFARQPSMIGIIAGVGSLSFQAQHMITEASPPILNPWMSHTELFSADSRLINLAPSSFQIAKQLGQELSQRNISTVQLLTEATALSEDLAVAIETEAIKAGLEVHSKIKLDPTKPLAQQLKTQQNTATDAIILVLHSQLLEQSLEWYEDQPDIPLLISAVDWTVSANAPNLLSLQSWHHGNTIDDIIAAYTDHYGNEPASVSTLLQSHDAAWILLFAATRCEAGLSDNIKQALNAAVPCERVASDFSMTAPDQPGQFRLHLAPAYRQTDSKRGTP
ncbi:MAG: DctP family TRAP transporter solute-binding subunit [Marinobacterium sp.]